MLSYREGGGDWEDYRGLFVKQVFYPANLVGLLRLFAYLQCRRDLC
jgi:hypothetical protein